MDTPIFLDFNDRYQPNVHDDLYFMAWRRGVSLPLGAVVRVTDHDEMGERNVEVVIKDYEQERCVVRLMREGT